jgi:tetratricopeptide (TPR) repeat protein
MRGRSLLLVLSLVLALASAAWAESPVEAARALVARYHEDLTRLDRARELLEAALARDRRVETMVMLAHVQFLVGDVRAVTAEDKLAAYERGREIGRRAVELAPRSPDAHLWYAINTARWGETRGVLRSLFLLPTIREELTTLLELDPRSVRAHVLTGNVLLEVPEFIGGDRSRAEYHFKKALAIDPRFTNARVDLARAYIADARYADARRELTRVVNETRPSVVADWTVKDAPRARKLLEAIKDRS